MNTEDVVEAYIAIRTERDKLRMEYEAKDAALKTELAEISAVLLKVCNEVGADSIKTKHGTVMRSLTERFTCSDWDNFFNWDGFAPQLLERRIHQGNMKELLAGSENDGLPPGVSVMREYGVTVRKPSK
jgi:hypothetical protein